jgi:hypothetical protein
MLAGAAYALDLAMWDTYGNMEWDPRCRVGFLGDGKSDYEDAPPWM